MARDNTFKTKALAFIDENRGKGLKRKDYIAAFVGFGMKESAASLYHYLHVTKVAKRNLEAGGPFPIADDETTEKVVATQAPEIDEVEAVTETPVESVAVEEDMVVAAAPKRDARGRFVKRT